MSGRAGDHVASRSAACTRAVSAFAETTTTPTRQALALLLLALASPPDAWAARAECLGGWRLAAAAPTPGNARLVCTDGDPACDADGVADGTCRLAVSYCLNLAPCAPGQLEAPTFRGPGAEALAAAAGALVAPIASPGVCPEAAEITLALGGHRQRKATIRAQVRDAASGRRDVDRLKVVCRGSLAGGRAIVVTTDFETGVLATVGANAAHRVRKPATRIHSDAVVRVADGVVFVLNRFLGDNLQRLEPGSLRTRFQCSTGTASNPHDIAVVAPDKAYVTRYDRAELWIVDPSVGADCRGFRRGTIDLRPFADGDGLPEMSQMAVVDGRLFVAIQRLDRRIGFRATGPGRMIVIDVASDAVVGEIPLFGANPFGDATGIPRDPATGWLVVSSVGDIYGVGDGGLERVDPHALRAEGRFYVDEKTVGGNILDFVLLSPTQGYAVVQDGNLKNHLVRFDPSGAAPAVDVYNRQAYLPDIVVGPDGLLWLADQGLPDPGIRFFDPATDEPLRRRPLRLGLPPFSIGFAP
ncbi:MAG: hypothetical protein KIT14_23295 [bacterium]|nr:hypothetical protein [bacterium]